MLTIVPLESFVYSMLDGGKMNINDYNWLSVRSNAKMFRRCSFHMSRTVCFSHSNFISPKCWAPCRPWGKWWGWGRPWGSPIPSPIEEGGKWSIGPIGGENAPRLGESSLSFSITSSCFFKLLRSFARRFWNQILTCEHLSVKTKSYMNFLLFLCFLKICLVLDFQAWGNQIIIFCVTCLSERPIPFASSAFLLMVM